MSRHLLSPKHLIFVVGAPGSGKSTLSSGLLKYLNCAYVESNSLADAFARDTRRSEEYRRLVPKLYLQLFRLAELNLSVGNSVLIDAPFMKSLNDQAWRMRVRALGETHKANLFFVQCHCSVETLQKRLLSRAEHRDDWKLDNWDEFIASEYGVREIPFPQVLVNTEEPLRDSIPRVLEMLSDCLY